MYELNDTIVAVSSPASEKRVIIRISGPATIDKVGWIFSQHIGDRTGVISGTIGVDDGLKVDAELYLFRAPDSYTGDDVAEIHTYAGSSVTEALMGGLLGGGLRMALPGEFTARRFLAGKIDLAQAEAVAEVVTSSNRFQLAAAERLLAGRLGDSIARIRSSIMDCLSQIEARLDFSGEDIEFITVAEAVKKLGQIKKKLQQLLAGSISCELVIDLPSVGIAGAPNSGKSRLLNTLLGQERSIVSDRRKTTRDVLTGLCTLTHCRAVLFDCAGLITSPNNILDELSQQAAVGALGRCSVVVFCIDISKTDFSEDIAIRKLIEPNILIPVATKSDLLGEDVLAKRIVELNRLFGTGFISTSAKTGSGIEQLRDIIDGKIIEPASGAVGLDTNYGVALTARHRQAVTEAVEDIGESIEELKAGNDEVAAMMLRAAYQGICGIEQQNIDEQILERIFSRFCVGK